MRWTLKRLWAVQRRRRFKGERGSLACVLKFNTLQFPQTNTRRNSINSFDSIVSTAKWKQKPQDNKLNFMEEALRLRAQPWIKYKSNIRKISSTEWHRSGADFRNLYLCECVVVYLKRDVVNSKSREPLTERDGKDFISWCVVDMNNTSYTLSI